MLTHEILDTQSAIELPAREMLAFFNWANVTTQQANYSLQIGVVNLASQSNSSLVVVAQG